MRIDHAAVLGVGMTRFQVWKERSNLDLAREAGLAALADAGLRLSDVDEAWVGYLAPQPMLGVRVMKEFGLTGLPVTHIENASATGLAAFREAAWAVSSGRCRVAMAIGFDKMSELAAGGQRGRGAGRDSIENVILPAAYFALWAMRRMHERGTKPEHFAAIAAKNWNHGAENLLADRRAKDRITPEAVLASPMVSEPLTAMMACPVDDGAACAIVAHPDVVKEKQPGRPVVRVRSSVCRSETYAPGHTFVGAVVGPPSITHDTANLAYEAAGLGPEDIDLALCHDAFANEELEYYELLGFAEEGGAERLVEEGATRLGGRIPFNTDGGLIARGHPGGPTGLAMIHELTLQLRGEAGPRQVEDARVGLAHLVGGGSVCAVNLHEREH